MFTTPAGTPASLKAHTNSWTDAGVRVAGLMTAVLPQVSAGKSFHEGIAIGKFHGQIMPQTPIGWRVT